MNKPKVVKDFDKVSDDVIAQIKLEYPHGFERKLITFKNKDGKFVSALPFESDEYYYLIRMTRQDAQEIIEESDDYDDDGNLTDDAKERLEEEIGQEVDSTNDEEE